MKIPVILYDLCSGTGPDDPALRVHAAFKAEDAARRVLLAVKSEQGAGTLILPQGDDVFAQPASSTVDAESIADAVSQGFTIDMDALQTAWAASAASGALDDAPPANPPETGAGANA